MASEAPRLRVSSITMRSNHRNCEAILNAFHLFFLIKRFFGLVIASKVCIMYILKAHEVHIMNDSRLNIKLDGSLKKAFVDTCKANDSTASREIRIFIRDYVMKQSQGKLSL